MMIEEQTAVAAAAAVAVAALYSVYALIIYPVYLHPLSPIPGPKPTNFPLTILGNLPELLREEATAPQLRYAQQYSGGIVKYYGIFNDPRVLVTSSTALRRIFGTHPHIYGRNTRAMQNLTRFLGKGLLTIEDEFHKRQRSLINPVFRVKQITALIPTFITSALELRDVWATQIAAQLNNSTKDEAVGATTTATMPLHNLDLLIVNIDKEMSKPTLDIIGRAGFGYDFQSVKNGLSSQYENVFKKAFESFTLPNAIIDLFFPFLNWIVPHRRKMKRGLAETEAGIREYCREIFETRKKEVLASDESGDNTECKDLLSVLVRGNLAADVQDQLTDEEVMAQIMTFLVAGHETTSVSLTWTFDFLSNNPLTQKKLRQEVLEYLPANADNEYFVEYITSTKTYLDAVCKESLRLVPSAPITSRRTNQDDTLDGYFIPKGTFISIVPGVNHRLPEYWGPDCLEFKPERWLHADSEKVEGIDDIESSGNTAEKSFGAYMPFLLGPRNCIGQRFAMLEMKSILAVLVASFEFEKIEQGVVKKKLTITWKPESGIKIGIKKAVY